MTDVVDSVDFKSSLPPRKRAKTKEEKEQRRVERILRNRRAAHASREKKRKHVEYLESYALKLELNLAKLQANLDLVLPLVDVAKLPTDLQQIDDLLELKEKIHSNVGTSTTSGDDTNVEYSKDSSADAEPSVKRQRLASEPVIKVELEGHDQEVTLSSPIKSDSLDQDNDLMSVSKKDNVYFNYLSPISINSPINSPIDLTLRKSDADLDSFSLDATHPESSISSASSPIEPEQEPSTFDIMGQNPEAVLYPKYHELGILSEC